MNSHAVSSFLPVFGISIKFIIIQKFRVEILFPRRCAGNDLLRSLVRTMGLAVILVTHDLAVARLLSHRLIVMHQGHMVETGLTDQVLDDPQHPYTQLLVSSILQV